MTGKKRTGLKDRAGVPGSPAAIGNPAAGEAFNSQPCRSPDSGPATFIRSHAPALIIFFFALFFIISVSNPAIYMNDEWITANQLHQLDSGHQVTFSEGKYGVTQNGTVSAYFTSRQNVLMYSLALPVAALPLVKLFGIFGDNFRLLVILLWSLCPVLIALLIDQFSPGYAQIRGIRILVPTLFLALLLFMGNILLYKQFPFSAADAPFEVAALVLTNQVFFALIAAVIFSILQLLVRNSWMALFGTLASVSCSSYIFWSAAAKDHILTTLVFLLLIYTFLLYLAGQRSRYAALAFVFSGLLVWIRPEVGFFVTLFLGLYFTIPLVRAGRSCNLPPGQLFRSLLPAAGVLVGTIPFFINNIIIGHSWLIPVFDLPKMTGSALAISRPLPLSSMVTDPTVISEGSSALSPAQTLLRAGDLIGQAFFGGFTYDNLVRGLIGTMTFPENGSIGFLIMCPIAVIGIVAALLWRENILAALRARSEAVFFILLMMSAIFFSYLTRFGSMNTSMGVLPDMRYLSPAYAPCGILAVFVLSKTPCLSSGSATLRSLLKYFILGSAVLLPVMFFAMLFIQPFGNGYVAYSTFFKVMVVISLLLCTGAMILARAYSGGIFARAVPYLLVLVLITAFGFQIMLTSFYALIVKINGYPFWIPLVREGVGLFLEVQYMAPV